MVHATYSADVWPAPTAPGPLDATVRLPGSKSLTNRELVLSALADGPSRLRDALIARDTELMVAALRSLGTGVERDGEDLVVTPGPLRGGTSIDVGLAGTLMRFLPPVAALAEGDVRFDGDERARLRPMATTILSLRALGVGVDDEGRGTLPFTVRGSGRVTGGPVLIDASESSQFVSGLLLSGARFEEGLEVEHRGARLPSLPHIEMTLDALRRRGVRATADVDEHAARWTVPPHRIHGRDVAIEPDLSNAGPFLAAAIVAGGRVAVPGWPASTTQVGDRLRGWLAAFGADVAQEHGTLVVSGPGVATGPLHPVDLDLGAGGELAPTLVGLAAFADGTSTFTGIGHLRGHETDRLAALVAELGAVGVAAEELEDGLLVHGGRPVAGARPWRSYADHRMATTGALLGLAVPGLAVEDVASTAKTLPGFVDLWTRMLP
ncbi:3-phosphoshikimate 1-carboxyvinyltransferase [Amnibacterium kyonggiense]|uniref:3-phosphoshikimate 1-carboxyvinyltransferase n=1 Tax=Amnibacterium kyonggiense TaxID=595671 RepID=A0A4R7FET7_9MICO|nr:3-phosphoshikimate 1-carboxyvinyltransferase [Amnibacterium kyonggiense]TDS75883.1 3-phosphoshikimate 1-carboxyvinyltransferase [Amnibacterium kyonggiense]